jgi:hypothetical protein
VGSIHEFGTRQQARREIPVVSLHLRLIDAESGKVVWAAEHALDGDARETVFGLGRVASVDQLAQTAVREALSSLEQLLMAAES